jgi:tRNA A-37 threonylcarbamoyl transferase component Bud32
MEMSEQALVESLLDRWMAAQEQGVTLRVDELCQTCPDLREALAERIADLKSFENRLAAALRKADAEPDRDDYAELDLQLASGINALQFHAKGGLGAVFIGEDRELHRTVAVKFIHSKLLADPAARQRFELEAELTGRLEHPGVVPLYGIGQSPDGRLFYVMRYIDGVTLDDAIRQYHATPASQASERTVEFHRLLNAFVSVCQTIGYAHYRGIVHRDIKPSNVMLGRYGETIVVDWGLATPVAREDRFRITGEKTLMPSSGSDAGTSSGGGAGTPAYMSPEQASNLAPTPASDIYSLGATLFKLLTGANPVIGETLAEVKANIIDGRTKRLLDLTPGTPKALDAICHKAMALRPNERYGTAIELARDVERYLADEPVSAYTESRSAQVARFVRRHRVATQVAAVGLIACAAIVGVSAIWLARLARNERQAHESASAAHIAAEASRRENLGTSAMFLAKSVAQEIDLRWRILEAEAESPELRRLVKEFNATIGAPADVERPKFDAVQTWLADRNIENRDAVRSASWLVSAADGTQLARVPKGPSIGQNFRHRDYFHGLGHEIDPGSAEAETVGPLDERLVHMSAVFDSTVTKTLMVAFSVPIWSDPRETTDRKRIGVLSMTVELGDFSTGPSALLVDTRVDQFGGRGLVLHHPEMGHLEGQEKALRITAPTLERALLLRRNRAGNGRSVEVARDNLLESFVDPVSDITRLAAIEPVIVHGRHATIGDTGWVVIAAERAPELTP